MKENISKVADVFPSSTKCKRMIQMEAFFTGTKKSSRLRMFPAQANVAISTNKESLGSFYYYYLTTGC